MCQIIKVISKLFDPNTNTQSKATHASKQYFKQFYKKSYKNCIVIGDS